MTKKIALLLVAVILVLGGCASFQSIVKPPTATVVDTRLERVDFAGADLVLDVQMTNPNFLGVTLSGYDYHVAVEGKTLLQGDAEESITVPANGSSVVPVPVGVVFADIIELSRDLASASVATYQVTLGLTFPLPLIGDVRVELNHDGVVPLPKLPRVEVTGLDLRRITLAQADMVLGLRVRNPSSFGLGVSDLVADLRVNDRSWAQFGLDTGEPVPAGGQAVVELPFSLNFGEVGRSVYTALVGAGAVSYALVGSMTVEMDLRGMGPTMVSFELDGSIRPTR